MNDKQITIGTRIGYRTHPDSTVIHRYYTVVALLPGRIFDLVVYSEWSDSIILWSTRGVERYGEVL